jgi:hypothetical protein
VTWENVLGNWLSPWARQYVYTSGEECDYSQPPPAILMTAEVIISDQHGNSEIGHVLFDTGAQGSLANTHSFQVIQPNLRRSRTPKLITGINSDRPITLTHQASFFISPSVLHRSSTR